MEATDGRYQQIYQTTPVSLWEEYWRAVFDEFERLREQGITDFSELIYSRIPTFVFQLASKVRITDINAFSLQIFEVDSREALMTSLDSVFDQHSRPVGGERGRRACFSGDASILVMKTTHVRESNHPPAVG